MSYSSNITDFKLKFHWRFLSLLLLENNFRFYEFDSFPPRERTQFIHSSCFFFTHTQFFSPSSSSMLSDSSLSLRIFFDVCAVRSPRNDCQWKHQKRSIKFQFLIVIKERMLDASILKQSSIFLLLLLLRSDLNALHLTAPLSLASKIEKLELEPSSSMFHDSFPFSYNSTTRHSFEFNIFLFFSPRRSLSLCSALDGWVRNRESKEEIHKITIWWKFVWHQFGWVWNM